MEYVSERGDGLTRAAWTFHISAIGDGRIVVTVTHYRKEERSSADAPWKIVERFGRFAPGTPGKVLTSILERPLDYHLAEYISEGKIDARRIQVEWPDETKS